MQVKVKSDALRSLACDVLVAGLFSDTKHLNGLLAEADRSLSAVISGLMEDGEITGKLEETCVIHCSGKLKAKKIIVVGLGESQNFSYEEVRRAAAAAFSCAKKIRTKSIATLIHGGEVGGLEIERAAQAIVEASFMADYSYSGYKTKKEDLPEVEELILIDNVKAKIAKIKSGAKRGAILGGAINRTRDLVHDPSNHLTPVVFAQYVKNLAKNTKLKCTVLGLSQILGKKMEAFYSVARGAKNEPRFVVLEYRPEGAKGKTIGLVGKGITFDSGGISIKPSRKMWEMKTDMAGAAAVAQVMRAISDLGLKKHVIAALPLTENMPGSDAQKPGDVVGSLSGKTIEIISTDAEGRLIVADGITYLKQMGADEIIDVATLTGACTVALGDVATGIMGNDQKLVDAIIESGKIAGEKFWQLPLFKEFEDYSKSQVADIKNATELGKAGTALGGIFLKLFAEDTPWAHLDIAGTAYLDKGRGYLKEGATGVAVRTLVQYLSQ